MRDTPPVAQDEGIKRDREHQELPESDHEEPGGDEETVGARLEHNERWLMTPTVS